ncbi:metabotropic glutamate receptor-like [Elysia marginata]|uniref:Metabotropic glutamate receptor-like n=1 Tax=Elysia marginata TaxID=1093978 RepID=A0AAV4I4H1_9GAST|nr:metabotropic glutamate receptor-like [Elysia marginata]
MTCLHQVSNQKPGKFYHKPQISLLGFRLGLLHLLLLQSTTSGQRAQDVPLKSYVKEGDINVGAFLPITSYSPFKLCGDMLRFPLAQQYVEALMFAVDEINKDSNLLPNTTLGMVIVDDCAKQSTASAQAVRFLTRLNHNNMRESSSSHSTASENIISGATGHKNHKGSRSNATENSDREDCRCCQDHSNHFDVVGVLSPIRSDTSTVVSYLLGPAHIPQLSFSANSDELSNPHLHPYFLRLIPPASREVVAVLEFIARQGWTYVSVVTGSGSYGDAVMKAIRWEAFRLGICVATHVKTRLGMADCEYRKLVHELLHFPSARAVVSFVGISEIVGLLMAVQEVDVAGWLVWVGSDAWANHISLIPDYLRPALHGSFVTVLDQPRAPQFEEHFRRLKPHSNTNPWFRQFWERQFNCSYQAQTCDENADITKSNGFHFLSLNSLVIDSVYVYAHALTELMKAECHDVMGSSLRDCITGSRLLAYLNKVSFQGITGSIKMGEERALYTVNQILPGKPFKLNPVARIDATVALKSNGVAGRIDVSSPRVEDVDLITWGRWFAAKPMPADSVFGDFNQPICSVEELKGTHSSQLQSDGFIGAFSADTIPSSLYLDSLTLDRSILEFQINLAKMSYKTNESKKYFSRTDAKHGGFPESSCRRMCKPGEVSVIFKSPCCWDCRPCRNNEIVTRNGTKCSQCPLFHWPDKSSGLTICTPIPADYTKFTDLSVMFEVATSCLGIVVSLAVCVAFVCLRESKVIKASGRELSSIQLFAIVLGYSTMLLYAAPPSDVSCRVAYFLFCLTLDLLYAALLVKSVRIYRIFNAGGKGTRGLRLVSPLSQVIIVCCIVLGQGAISTCVTGLRRTSAHLSQPSRSEPYVEIACDMSIPAVSTFLAYNLTLVVLCAVLAFKTRSLPDNFRESRYISMCVTTTLVIWLAFIPTFLTSSRESLKTLLLSLALLLNHSVALVFLFLSKLYAAIYRRDVPVIVLPVRTHSGQDFTAEGATNCIDTGSGFTNGVKSQFRTSPKHSRCYFLEEREERRVSADVLAPEQRGSGVHVDTPANRNDVEQTAIIPLNPITTTTTITAALEEVQIRKTGRFTVITHTGGLVRGPNRHSSYV